MPRLLKKLQALHDNEKKSSRLSFAAFITEGGLKLAPAGTNSTSRTYWDPFYVDGTHYPLSHLEPFEFFCTTPDGFDRKVRVIYTPHVFTKDVSKADQSDSVIFDDRVFDQDRYNESFKLHSIISNLPSSHVFQTWEKRNYVFLAFEVPNPTERYHIFFEVKKAGGKRNKHIEMRVESAYRKLTSSYTPPSKPNSIRFSMLVQNIFYGRPIKFAVR